MPELPEGVGTLLIGRDVLGRGVVGGGAIAEEYVRAADLHQIEAAARREGAEEERERLREVVGRKLASLVEEVHMAREEGANPTSLESRVNGVRDALAALDQEGDNGVGAGLDGRGTPSSASTDSIAALDTAVPSEEAKDGERCEDCGGPVGLVWWCHDDLLWEKVTGKPKPAGSRESAAGILCIQCFDRKAKEICPWIEWAPLNLRHLQSKEEEQISADLRHSAAPSEPEEGK